MGICAALVVASLAVTASAQSFEPLYTEEELALIAPTSTDPLRSFLAPGTVPDYDFWLTHGYWKTQNRPTPTTPRAFVEVDEVEPNNFTTQAQPINLGTAGGKFNEMRVNGTFSTFTFIQTVVAEENGSIPKAIPTNLGVGEITAAMSEIGDGIHGSSGTQQGDFDFYKTDFLPAGVFIEADITTFDAGATFSSYLMIWNASGQLLAEDGAPGRDAEIGYRVSTPGFYYIAVGGAHDSFAVGGTGFDNNVPRNPFLPGSGAGYGSEGLYNITIRVSDVDYVEVELQAGDVLAISSESPFSVALEASLETIDGEVMISSTAEIFRTFGVTATYLYPDSSPFSSIFGNIHAPYVIDQDGTYRIAFRGTAPVDYSMDLRVLRPGLETATAPNPVAQVIYLNMGEVSLIYTPDGDALLAPPMRVNPSVFDEFLPNREIDITPFYSFLNQLFELDTELPVRVAEFNFARTLMRDYVASHLPGNVQVVIGERVDADDENSAEILIGGTIAETRLNTIGISETIDPGNFEVHEQAIVLLDTLANYIPTVDVFSVQTGDPDIDGAEADRQYRNMVIKLIGNIVVHEAGHFLGNFHTDNGNSVYNIMDQGGFIEDILGLGPDDQYNTIDDFDPVFLTDVFADEIFSDGFENSEAVVRFGVNAGAPDVNLSNLYVDYEAAYSGLGTIDSPFDNTGRAVNRLDAGGTINVYTSAGTESFTGAQVIRKPMTIRNITPESGVVRIGGE